MSLRVSCAAMLLMGASLLTAEADWRFAHPQSEMLLGIKVKPLVNSPLGETFRQQTSTMGLAAGRFDLLDEIDEIYISAVSKRGKNGKVTDSDGLVLLIGNFDGGKLMKVLQGPEFQKSGEKLTPRFIDRSTILLGDEDTMIAAVERLKDPTQKNALFTNPLFARARELDDANHLWVVGSAAPLAGASGPADGPFSFLNDLRSFSFGLGMGDQMRLDIGVNMRTRKAADELISAFQSMQEQMRKQMKDPAEWDKIADNLKLSSAGTSLRLQMAMDTAELRKSMDQVMAARSRASATEALLAKNSPAPANNTPPPPPPPPARRTVIVYGQESGTREIPVPSRLQ